VCGKGVEGWVGGRVECEEGDCNNGGGAGALVCGGKEHEESGGRVCVKGGEGRGEVGSLTGGGEMGGWEEGGGV